MQALSGLFAWTGAQRDDEPPPSVLAEWQKYNDDPSDPGAAPSGDGLMTSMEEGTARLTSFVSTSFKKVSSTVGEGSGGLQRTLTTVASTRFQVPTGQQLAYFFAFMAGGIFFLVLSFSLFLPIVIIAPAKFAFSFSIGSVLILGAFASLRGWQQQFQHMFSKDRLPFSAGYIGSIAATLYTALIMHSYVFSLVCCALQVVALLYYVLSYFPGGAAGAQFVLNMFYQTCVSCFQRTFR